MLAECRDDPRLVGIGEIGLDFFVKDLDEARQRFFYLEQLKLAKRHGLPVILHVRRSADQLLAGLRRIGLETGGIGHAFNGSRQQADAFLALGFKLGFGGTVTFDRSLQIRRLAAELPEEALVVETDAPDIPPHWLYRTAEERAAGASSRNEPGELPRIGACLAGLRGWTPEQAAAITTRNAHAALPRLAALLPSNG
jgi:TatD DNase family protein